MGLGTLVGGWADHHKSLASTHVLVVDDEQVVGDLLTELLEDEGFKVHVAGSAEVAWELIQAGEYQLVITDKNLPGESGIDLIKRIAGASIDVPVVLITGYPSISSVSQALASGAADYIAKPFDDVMVVLRRLTLVADRNRSRRLFREILNDLARVVKGADDGRQRLAEIQEAHRGFHDALAGRPDVLLCDRDPTRATAGIMRASGLASSTAPTR